MPLLLDAAERGYTPAMIPLAGAYADGKGVPKSFVEAYKWGVIAERWHVPNADQIVAQLATRAEARGNRAGESSGNGFHLQDEMIAARAALLAALLGTRRTGIRPIRGHDRRRARARQ